MDGNNRSITFKVNKLFHLLQVRGIYISAPIFLITSYK